MQAKQLGIGHVFEALFGVESVDPEVFVGEFLQGFDEGSFVAEAFLDDLQRCFFHDASFRWCVR